MSGAIQRLRDRGYVDDDLQAAMEAADRRAGLTAPFDDLAGLDVPLPPARGDPPGLSPRGVALMLRAVEVEPDVSLLVVGRDPGYLADVARELTDGTVEQVEDPDEVTGTWDRLLWLPEASARPDVTDHLEELGSAVYREVDGDELDVVKVVRSGGREARMVLSQAHVVDDATGPTGDVEAPGDDLATLLRLESSLARVWTGSHLLQQERAWERSVESTWRSDPVGDATTDEWALARKLFHLAFVHQMHGDLETAVEVYTGSLEVAASAESYTFRGWVRSFLGDLDAAIADCKEAIDTDPSLGNPYNDIGCYLLERDDLDEAETWFERAKDATRYDAPHFPHLNLARLHLRRGDRDKALEAARESARINPQDPTTKELLRRLEEEES